MASHLDIPKAVQAAAIILKTDRFQRMPFIRMLKLLYVVERESLKERGRPVLGDRVVAMMNGPVLSEVYDLVKSEHIRAAEWSQFIRTDGTFAELLSFPGTGELSRWEIAKIHEVVSRYGGMDDWALVDHLHEQLPEWVRHRPAGNTANPIPLAHILEAVGRADDAEAIQADLRANRELRDLIDREAQ